MLAPVLPRVSGCCPQLDLFDLFGRHQRRTEAWELR